MIKVKATVSDNGELTVHSDGHPHINFDSYLDVKFSKEASHEIFAALTEYSEKAKNKPEVTSHEPFQLIIDWYMFRTVDDITQVYRLNSSKNLFEATNYTINKHVDVKINTAIEYFYYSISGYDDKNFKMINGDAEYSLKRNLLNKFKSQVLGE